MMHCSLYLHRVVSLPCSSPLCPVVRGGVQPDVGPPPAGEHREAGGPGRAAGHEPAAHQAAVLSGRRLPARRLAAATSPPREHGLTNVTGGRIRFRGPQESDVGGLRGHERRGAASCERRV